MVRACASVCRVKVVGWVIVREGCVGGWELAGSVRGLDGEQHTACCLEELHL